MLIDLHAHTNVESLDASLSPDELCAAAKRAGLDGICITEHDRFWDPAYLEQLGARHGLLVLPGCELTTEEGHILVYGLDRWEFGMHRAEYVRNRIDDVGGAMVAAHPYRRHIHPDDHKVGIAYEERLDTAYQNKALRLSHAAEGMNGRGTAFENRFARDLCIRAGVPAVAASDTHDPSDLGKCATWFHRPIRNVHDLITELRAGRFKPVDLRIGLPPA